MIIINNLKVSDNFEVKINPCGSSYRAYLIECYCGKVFTCRLSKIKSGHTRSCGCFHKADMSNRLTKHGLSNHKLYECWRNMIGRCYDPKNINYPRYGAKGITVCEEWKNDFMSFYNWGIKTGFAKGLELDRFPNNKGNYQPNNCRLATKTENLRNRVNNMYVEYNGENILANEWSKRLGANSNVVYGRIKLGWDIESAVTTPAKSKKYSKR